MADEELERAPETPGEPADGETPEPTRAEMTAYLVRTRSEKEGKLTPVNILAYEGILLSPEDREQLIADIEADESCSDIKVMRTSKGDAYLYSTAAMSDTYARILLRAAEDNPYAVIAGTVREESETYPRPTPVSAFRNSVFGLDPDQVEERAREIVQIPEYSDLKLVVASTGALYLYSDRHLGKDHAESLVEWEEVEKYRSL